jgi:ABC-type lipoprotein export system ATPase subunit
MNRSECLRPVPPALLIENLLFRYGRPTRDGAARGEGWIVGLPSLALERGEQMLLTGRSGQGKSTLLYLIAGLMEPNDGTVLVDGENIHALRGEKRDLFRGRRIGMIFQTFNLLQGFTALENVMAALMFSKIPQREHRSRANALLEELGIDQPGRRAEEMSVGQQQRVAVARALACQPALVLADEPTASLDPENAAAAMDLIQRACSEHRAALLCTSHDPALAARFERRAALGETSHRHDAEPST